MAKGGSNSSGAIAALNQGQTAAETQSLNNFATYARPEFVMPQTEDIRTMGKSLTPVSEYDNRAFEREFNPGAEEARLLEDKTIGDIARATAAGDIPTAESNAMKRGVLRDLATSGVKLGRGFNAGGNIAASIYGDRSSDYLSRMRALISNYLASKPRQAVNISPQDLISLDLSRKAGNVSAGNAFRQQLGGLGMQQISNVGARGMSGLQAAIQEAAQNRAANQQFWGGLAGSGLSAGATLGAAVL